jgi:hypothetical protein
MTRTISPDLKDVNQLWEQETTKKERVKRSKMKKTQRASSRCKPRNSLPGIFSDDFQYLVALSRMYNV